MDGECESGNCGSRYFHIGDDGFTYCSEGHRQSQTGLVTAEEDGPQSLGRRAIRKTQDEAPVLKGKEGVRHFLVCFQLVLWKQVHGLVQDQGFPKELEDIVHDLWTLRLNLLSDKLNNDADSGANEPRTFSSQDDNSEAEALSKKRKGTGTTLPAVLDGLAIIYVGVMLLRLQITMFDLYNKVECGQVLYYRTTHKLEKGMKPRLDGPYHQFLDPGNILSFDQLQTATSKTIELYRDAFGLAMPPFNHVLYIWRLVNELALPIEVHPNCIRLADIIKVDFDFSSSGDGRKAFDLAPPEKRIAALLIVTTKLLYPTDGRVRLPRRATEPAALVMDWSVWAGATQKKRIKGNAQPDAFNTALHTTEADIPNMSEHQLDEYLAWFRDMFVESDDAEGRANKPADATFRRTLRGFFPVDNTKEIGGTDGAGGTDGPQMSLVSPGNEHVKAVQAGMRPARVMAASGDDEVDRPGSHYRRHRKVDELEGHVKSLYEEVSRCTGIVLDELVRTTFAMERRMVEAQKKTGA